jgi:hypothetical protein
MKTPSGLDVYSVSSGACSEASFPSKRRAMHIKRNGSQEERRWRGAQVLDDL